MILSILDKLAATDSRLEKEDILTKEKDNQLLMVVLVAAYNPYINYYIKKIPPYEYVGSDVDLAQALSCLNNLSIRKYTGNAGIDYLGNLLAHLSPDDAEVISRIIDRDLRCGVNLSTINKIWNGLIPAFDVMLAHKDISGIKYPCYGQVKADGMRCHLNRIGGNITAWSRNGKSIIISDALCRDALSYMDDGETWDGELICVMDNKILDRKTGNGILNKAIKGTIKDDDLATMRFVAWDNVDFTSTIPYWRRWEDLLSRFEVKNKDSTISLIDTEIIQSNTGAQSFYDKCIAKGEEGAVLKNYNGLWVPKRTKDLGKMKAEEECDLKVIGMEEGTGKYDGVLGALVCETADGLLKVNVGTGFSDDDRIDYWDSNIRNVIVTVRYNQKIKDKKTGIHSLFLPRFVCVREDKDVANTLEEIK